MASAEPSEDALSTFRRNYPAQPFPSHEPTSQTGGPSDTFTGMSALSERLAKLEGGNDTLKWSVAVVSAALIGAAAALLVLQTVTISQVSSLGSKVEALPEQINRNLLELNRTLSSAITASKSESQRQPTVIIVPQPQPAAPLMVPPIATKPPPQESGG